jgi:hypothetical protein
LRVIDALEQEEKIVHGDAEAASGFRPMKAQHL